MHLRHTVLAALLFLPSLPAAAEPADDVRRLLNDANLEYQLLDGGLCRLVIEFTDGRSQLIFIQPMEPLEELELIEIYSPVMPVEFPLEESLARELLTSTGNQKLGYFGIEEVELGSMEAAGQRSMVFAYHNLPLDNLGSETLLAVLHTVAELADEMEKDKLGADSDEY